MFPRRLTILCILTRIAAVKLILTLLAAVLCACSPVAGEIITTADGNGADTYVQGNNSGPYGAAAYMAVKYASSSNHPTYTRKAYFRFDLGAFDVSQIADAQLALTIVDSGLGTNATGDWTFSVYGLTDESGDGWSENMLWNAAPANVAAVPQVDGAKTVPIGSFQLAGKGTIGSAITLSGSALTGFLQTDTNHLATFIVVRDTVEGSSTNYAHGFATRENGTYAPPTLTLTTVPEPSALALAAGAAGGFLVCGRRRRQRVA